MKPLKPVMAAFLAAAVIAFAPSGILYAGIRPSADAELNPVNILSSLVAQDPAARKDIGERLSRFVQGRDAKARAYLTAALLQDDKLLPAVAAVAKDWPEKNKDNPGKIAVLYFVLGPDGAQ